MNEVEQTRAEFEALTGLDPAAHRAIERQFDVPAARGHLSRALASRGPAHLARMFLVGGAIGYALWWAGAHWGGETSPQTDLATPGVEPMDVAPPLQTPSGEVTGDSSPTPKVLPSSASHVEGPGAPGPGARVPFTQSATSVLEPAAIPPTTNSVVPPPPDASTSPTTASPLPTFPEPGPSILPEKNAWTDARSALATARLTKSVTDYQRAARLADLYLDNPAWQTFRGLIELDRAEIALGAEDYAGAATRLRSRLAVATDPAERKTLLGMLVLAEAGRGTCDALRVVAGETHSQTLVARCNQQRARRP